MTVDLRPQDKNAAKDIAHRLMMPEQQHLLARQQSNQRAP
jgi:hypothetical protein